MSVGASSPASGESLEALHETTLRFFGRDFRYMSACERDITHIELIFRRFVSPSEPVGIDATFCLSRDQDQDYVASLLDPDVVRSPVVTLGPDGDWCDWTSESTPIPPLVVAPLAGKFIVLHGACITCHGETTAFIGPSFVGKSALLLECLKRGAQAVADDLVVVSVDDAEPHVWRYPKPVGVRNPTLNLLPWVRQCMEQVPVAHTLRFPEKNGRPATTIAHLDELLGLDPFVHDERLPLTRLFVLDRGTTGIRRLSSSERLAAVIPNTCESGASRGQIVAAVAKLVSGVETAMLGNQDVAHAAATILNYEDHDLL